MTENVRLGIIGGGGWLGSAIAEAVLRTGTIRPQNLCLSYRRELPARFPGASWTTENQSLANRSDVIIISVRPEDWRTLEVDAEGRLVISVMAGIRLSSICDRHNTPRVVRSLPNAAAEVGKSYTPWVSASAVTEDDRAIVRSIFDACGIQDEVGSERDVDYLTGLTGSGPAFPAMLAAAMMKHAIEYGLSQEVAMRAINTVIVGAGRLAEQRSDVPEELVDMFLSYRGTTAAAIEIMRTTGFEQSVARGLEAAFEKSLIMG